ncbi:MAG: hypothetical protein P8Y64_08945 [Gammaproteobacteria bacterium]
MQGTMFYVFALGFVLFVAGAVLIIRKAAQQGVVWTLVSIVPGLNLLFVFSHWNQAHRGFLMSIVGVLVAAGGFYGGGDKGVCEQLAEFGWRNTAICSIDLQRPGDVAVPNQAEVEAKGLADKKEPENDYSEYMQPKIVPLPPKGSIKKLPDSNVKMAWQVLSPKLAPSFVGRVIRISMDTGETKEGVMTKADDDSLYIQQNLGGGTADLQYSYSDLHQILVYAPQGSVAQALSVLQAQQQSLQNANQPVPSPATVPVQPTAAQPAPAQPAATTAPAQSAAPTQPAASQPAPATAPAAQPATDQAAPAAPAQPATSQPAPATAPTQPATDQAAPAAPAQPAATQPAPITAPAQPATDEPAPTQPATDEPDTTSQSTTPAQPAANQSVASQNAAPAQTAAQQQ